jgi:chorismate mutase
MKLALTPPFLFIAGTFALCNHTPNSTDFAAQCYSLPLPSIPQNITNATRLIPWGAPSFVLPNNTLCCGSLDQVRAGIDAIDTQILGLLAQRAGYVREATRFKATLDSVDVPTRDRQVIDGAVEDGKEIGVPEVLSRSVFEGIIEGGVGFEECVWGSFDM